MTDLSPMLSLLSQMIAPAFFIMLLLAGLGGAMQAAMRHLGGTTRGRVFSELMARQLSAMAWPHLLLALAASVAGFWSMNRQLPWILQRILDGPGLFAGSAVILAGLLCLLTARGWTRLQATKGLRLVLCLAAALLSLAALYLLIATTKDFTAAWMSGGLVVLAPSSLYLPGPGALFWPLLGAAFCLALADGGGMGLVWMVLRRERDDFGRDYYNKSVPKAALWALLAGLAHLACQGWLLATLDPVLKALTLKTSLGLFWLGGGVLLLLAGCCRMILVLSKTPMRLKGLAYLAQILDWGGHALVLTALVGLAPLA